MPQLKQISVFPQQKPEDSKIKVTLVEDDGSEKEIDALAGLTLIALTDMDFFMGVQGNILYPFYAITADLANPDSFFSQIFISALTTAIQKANSDELVKLYETQSKVMNFIADRQEELRNGSNQGTS